MSFNPTMYDTITTTSRRSALAKDDSRHDNIAETSQISIDFLDAFIHDLESTRRTVILSGIPGAMSLSTVLTKIRGGAIEESGLLGPFSLEGINIARVVFVDEPSAQAFVENADPSMFGAMNVSIDLVSTTGPVEDHRGHTRCLEIRNILVPVREEGLLAALGPDESIHPISMWKINNMHLILHFSSIENAGYAYSVLPWIYHGCQLHFLPDPCAEPLEPIETLLPPWLFLPS